MANFIGQYEASQLYTLRCSTLEEGWETIVNKRGKMMQKKGTIKYQLRKIRCTHQKARLAQGEKTI